MIEVIRYQIEARDLLTGYWRVKRECLCHYEREEYMGRFLFWKKLRSRIVNKVEAELKCRKEVMVCRRSYEKEFEDVRVIITKCENGHAWNSVVWENGKWKDC